MSIKSRVSTFGGLTKDFKHLIVEKYQRGYSWGDELIGRLFDDHFMCLVDGSDLEDSSDPFLGTIVVMPTDDGNAEIIDGQQRFTTVSLIYAAAARRLAALGGSFDHGECARLLRMGDAEPFVRLKVEDNPAFNVLVSVGLPAEDFEMRLQKTLDDAAARYRLITGSKGVKPKKDKLDPIHSVADTVEGKLEKYADRAVQEGNMSELEAVKLLLGRIRDGLRVVIVEVEGHSQGLAVFEAMNTVGLRLTVEQLILNCLMRAFPDKRQMSIIETYWDGGGFEGKSFKRAFATTDDGSDFLIAYHIAFVAPTTDRKAINAYRKLAREVAANNSKKFNSLRNWLVHMQSSWEFFTEYDGPLRSLGGKIVFPVLMLVHKLDWQSESLRRDAVEKTAFALEAALLRCQVCKQGLNLLSNAISDLCSEIRAVGAGSLKVDDLEHMIKKRLKRVCPKDSDFHDALIDKPMSGKRRIKLILARLNQAYSKSTKHIWDSENFDDSFRVVSAFGSKNDQTAARIESLGFDQDSFARLSKSLMGNLLKDGNKAYDAVPVNRGVSPNNPASRLINKRAKELAEKALEIWSLDA